MTFCPMTINRIHFITFETELKFEVYIKRVYKRIGTHIVNNNFFQIFGLKYESISRNKKSQRRAYIEGVYNRMQYLCIQVDEPISVS